MHEVLGSGIFLFYIPRAQVDACGKRSRDGPSTLASRSESVFMCCMRYVAMPVAKFVVRLIGDCRSLIPGGKTTIAYSHPLCSFSIESRAGKTAKKSSCTHLFSDSPRLSEGLCLLLLSIRTKLRSAHVPNIPEGPNRLWRAPLLAVKNVPNWAVGLAIAPPISPYSRSL
jgi:hypothetical protein